MIFAKQLYLEKLKKSDLSFYQSLYANETLMQHVGPVLDKEKATKSFNNILNKMAKDKPKSILYVIRECNNNKAIGVSGLRWNQPDPDSVEIGIILSQLYHGRGYAHLAKASLIKHAFDKLEAKTLIANCDEINIAANCANQKLGFTRVKVFLSEKNNKSTVKWQINKEKYQRRNNE